MKVAIIPARGGSKRIPRKNIKQFCGKPMIAWSIESAIRSDLFDLVIVSTDDAEIAEIAQQYHAMVPFLRPKSLSDDYSATTPVIAHAIDYVSSKIGSISSACCIYPTAPFLAADDLVMGYKIFTEGDWEYVFSATAYSAPVFRSFQKTNSGAIRMLFPENFSKRSQDLASVYHDAGQFYWGKPSAWVNGEHIFSDQSTIVEIPHWRVQDIDTEDDFYRAELLFKILNQQ